MLSTVFLIVAVILFAMAAIPPISRGEFLPVGLAFFAGSFLVPRLG